MSEFTILFAGGGTGGHVFPLVAVADALRVLAPEVRCVFIGTERGIEGRVVPARGYRLELLPVAPIRGGGVSGALRGVASAVSTLPASWSLVSRLKPRAVLSIGGYAAGPITVVARARGIPLALIEPNAVIGLANQLVAPIVTRAYTAFPEPERNFASRVVLRSGVPIRAGFEPQPYPAAGKQLSVLVLGGSQGARTLNEVVPAALAQATTPVRVVHQCGAAHEAAARARYAELGAGERARVVPFIDDMPAAIGAAELVISRSGASAVAEICAVGRPSLLIPYPHAAGDHQRANARSLEHSGAARCCEPDAVTPERVASLLDGLVAESQLRAMAASALRLGRPQAADTIARDLLTLAGYPTASRTGAGPADSGTGGDTCSADE